MEIVVHEHTSEEVRNLLSGPSATPSAISLLERAWEFAKKAHKGQQRRSGAPHTEHLFYTARNLSELGMGATVIAAGILHDTIEDTRVTYEDIQKEFGTEIAFLVDGVTKLKKQHLPNEEYKVQSLRKMLVAASYDPRIVVIKLCDRLHNMETLQYMPPRKQQSIARETLEIYVPAAERLGIGSIRRKLEELSFPYAFPAEYEKTMALYAQVLPERLKAAERIKESIIAAQQKEFIEIHIRTKGTYSFFRKLERKDGDLSRMQDIVAVQIIVPTVDSCYVTLGLVHAIGRPCPGCMKDFISFPRPNGYRSLRTVIQQDEGIPTEIQIFTLEFFHHSLYGNANELSRKTFETHNPFTTFLNRLFGHENFLHR